MNEVANLIEKLEGENGNYLRNYFANAPKWIFDEFQTVKIEKDKVFIHENSSADTVYILVDGIVRATDYRIQEIAYDYARFFPIEIFGVMEFLMEYEEYKTTLTTETDCTFLKISKEHFSKWIITDIHAVLEQVKAMSKYLLKQVRKERLFLFLQGSDRIFFIFMQMYQGTAKNGVCKINLTRKYLSNSTGICIKTVNRCVKKMEKDGYISRNGRSIVIDSEQYLKIKEILSEKIDDIEI